MATTELERLNRLYPGAIGRGVIEGSRHMVRRELRRWEERGEVIALWRFQRVDRTGVMRIPYVRLKTREEVARRRMVRVVMLAGAGTLFLGTVLAIAWNVRYQVAGAVGMIALTGLSVRMLAHWRRGCSGLHCSGCRG